MPPKSVRLLCAVEIRSPNPKSFGFRTDASVRQIRNPRLLRFTRITSAPYRVQNGKGSALQHHSDGQSQPVPEPVSIRNHVRVHRGIKRRYDKMVVIAIVRHLAMGSLSQMKEFFVTSNFSVGSKYFNARIGSIRFLQVGVVLENML